MRKNHFTTREVSQHMKFLRVLGNRAVLFVLLTIAVAAGVYMVLALAQGASVTCTANAAATTTICRSTNGAGIDEDRDGVVDEDPFDQDYSGAGEDTPHFLTVPTLTLPTPLLTRIPPAGMRVPLPFQLMPSLPAQRGCRRSSPPTATPRSSKRMIMLFPNATLSARLLPRRGQRHRLHPRTPGGYLCKTLSRSSARTAMTRSLPRQVHAITATPGRQRQRRAHRRCR
jgi:hypothetical protein